MRKISRLIEIYKDPIPSSKKNKNFKTKLNSTCTSNGRKRTRKTARKSWQRRQLWNLLKRRL